MTRDTLGALVLVAIAALAGLGGWAAGAFDGEPRPADYDRTLRSTDLPSDLQIMWETANPRQAADSFGGPDRRPSTDRAINAASRVFNSIPLVGRPRTDVVAILGEQNGGLETSANLFADARPSAMMVYRFDAGAYGWQFNLVLDADDKVTEVKREWHQ